MNLPFPFRYSRHTYNLWFWDEELNLGGDTDLCIINTNLWGDLDTWLPTPTIFTATFPDIWKWWGKKHFLVSLLLFYRHWHSSTHQGIVVPMSYRTKTSSSVLHKEQHVKGSSCFKKMLFLKWHNYIGMWACLSLLYQIRLQVKSFLPTEPFIWNMCFCN